MQKKFIVIDFNNLNPDIKKNILYKMYKKLPKKAFKNGLIGKLDEDSPFEIYETPRK